IAAGDATKEETRRASEMLTGTAIELLKVAIQKQEYTKSAAEDFLVNSCNIRTRQAARDLIEQNDGRLWTLIRHLKLKGKPFILEAITEGKNESTAEMQRAPSPHSVGSSGQGISAALAGIGRRECLTLELNKDSDPSAWPISAANLFSPGSGPITGRPE